MCTDFHGRRTNMSEQERQVTLVIFNIVVKGYHACTFSVDIGDQFVAQKKRGDRGNALKVIDDRGQL